MNFIKNLFAVAVVGMTIAFVGCNKEEVIVNEGSCPDVTCSAEQLLDVTTCTCVDKVVVPTGPTEVSGNVKTNTTWSGDVILNSRVAVESGATLTIEPGTVIKGQAGAGANSTALVVAKGGKIMAEGTAAMPIIFTSVADKLTAADVKAGNYASPNLGADVNGLWGGVIVLGDAPISAKNGETSVQIEGIPTSDANGSYGGSNADDNSGVLKYVSIRHGGTNIGEGNEINGLTLGGVGAGTTVMNIEVVGNQDDGIEIFGGTVNVSNILLWNCGDDSIDTDQAWNGTLDGFIIVTPTGGSAMELDGPEGDYTQGDNTIMNGVVYAGSNIDHIIDWDSNTNSIVKDVYFFGLDAAYAGKGFETFGGSTTGSGNYEYTLPEGGTVEQFFANVPADQLKAVAADAYTNGPAAADFAWTWASASIKSLGIK